MKIVNRQTPMREIEIFGVPALFTAEEIPPGTEIPGMFMYELLSAEDGETLLGTVFTVIPVDIPDEGGRDVYDDDLLLDTEAGYLTPAEFEEKYLSPESAGQERYGKDE